jgi:hypothetical protein
MYFDLYDYVRSIISVGGMWVYKGGRGGGGGEGCDTAGVSLSVCCYVGLFLCGLLLQGLFQQLSQNLNKQGYLLFHTKYITFYRLNF